MESETVPFNQKTYRASHITALGLKKIDDDRIFPVGLVEKAKQSNKMYAVGLWAMGTSDIELYETIGAAQERLNFLKQRLGW